LISSKPKSKNHKKYEIDCCFAKQNFSEFEYSTGWLSYQLKGIPCKQVRDGKYQQLIFFKSIRNFKIRQVVYRPLRTTPWTLITCQGFKWALWKIGVLFGIKIFIQYDHAGYANK